MALYFYGCVVMQTITNICVRPKVFMLQMRLPQATLSNQFLRINDKNRSARSKDALTQRRVTVTKLAHQKTVPTALSFCGM